MAAIDNQILKFIKNGAFDFTSEVLVSELDGLQVIHVSDFEDDDSTATPDCVLFVGRLVKSKGVYDAIEIWKESKEMRSI